MKNEQQDLSARAASRLFEIWRTREPPLGFVERLLDACEDQGPPAPTVVVPPARDSRAGCLWGAAAAALLAVALGAGGWGGRDRASRVAIGHHLDPSGKTVTLHLLEMKVAALRQELMRVRAGQGGAQPGEGRRSAIGWVDLTHRELQILARHCDVRYDMSPAAWEAYPNLSERLVGDLHFTSTQWALLEEGLREASERYVRQLRTLYVEVTGDRGAAARLSPASLHREILQRSAAGQLSSVRERLAHERAGESTPPADLAAGPPAERLIRLAMASGEEWEERLAAVAGRERARQLRRAGTGFSRWRTAGCPGQEPF